MNQAQFKDIIRDTFNACERHLTLKGAEYEDGKDRLSHFKTVAAKRGQTIVQAWASMYGKHAEAVDSFVRKLNAACIGEGVGRFMASHKTDGQCMSKSEVGLQILEHVQTSSVMFEALGQVEAELSEPIEGRIDDLINYLLFLKAILAEYRGKRGGGA